jgi:hypothetical protein
VREPGDGGMTGQKIEFRTIEIKETIRSLADFSSTLCNNPGFRKKEQEKFSRWVGEQKKMLDQISLFEIHVLPLIADDLGYPFANKNLVLIAMMQRGMRKTFTEIKKQFGESPQLPISPDELDFLIVGPDTAASLAWVGDTAINYAILSYIWEPGITPEKLHDKRKPLETNKNLSDLCDRWNLYSYRFFLDSAEPQQKRLETIKGTLTEAIFGVIFIERDIPGVKKALHLIDPTNNLMD